MIPIQYYSYPFQQYLSYADCQYVKLPLYCSYHQDSELFNGGKIGSQLKTTSQDKRPDHKGEASQIKTQGVGQKKKVRLEKELLNKRKFVDKPIGDQQNFTKQKSEESRQRQQIQKDGRNANSNLLRMFFRTLQHRLEDKSLINLIIVKNKLKTDYRKFTDWFQINRVEYKNYIRLPSVKKLFFGKKNDDNTKIMRILLNDFRKTEAFCFYLTSKKIKKAMMHFNYRSLRTIFQEIMKV